MTDSPPLHLEVRLPLDRFDLEVRLTARQHVTGIFGPSGAGKTRLLELIAGLTREERGRVALGDSVWLDTERGICLPPEARDVGYVPQEGLLFPHLDVRQNLLAGARRARRRGAGAATSLADVCELLELGGLLRRQVRSLSGGERQRVALGRAICSGPRLLLLDEPLASLDVPLRQRVLPFLRRVRRELQVPILYVSHDPTEVQTLCDELVVLEKGRVLAHGPTRRVLTDPRVFALAGEREDGGFHNLLPCRVADHRGATTAVRLGLGEGPLRLLTPNVPLAPGSEVFVAIPAHEIIIALGRPDGISALNVLPARVREVQPLGNDRLVTSVVAPDCPPITAKVTDLACDKLGLVPDLPVHLIIKVAACRLVAADGT